MNDPERMTTGLEGLEADEDQPLSSEELEAAFLELVTRRNWLDIEHEPYRKAFEVFRALLHAVRRDYIAGETPDEVDWHSEIIDSLHRKLNENGMQQMRMIAAIEDAMRARFAVDLDLGWMQSTGEVCDEGYIVDDLLERIGRIDERLRLVPRATVADEIERLHAAQRAQPRPKKPAYTVQAVIGKLYKAAGVVGNISENARNARNRKMKK